MKLIKIINARQVLDNLADKEDIGAHLSYWMTKFVVKTEPDYAFYISETRKVFERYAEGIGDQIIVPAEKIEAFKAEIDGIDNTDAEDPGIRFDLSELAAELKLSMKQMYPLLDFINEDK